LHHLPKRSSFSKLPIPSNSHVFPPLQTQILQFSHRTNVAEVNDILRTGNDITVAGYCMYGAATEMVITFKGDTLSRQGRQGRQGITLFDAG
jgi:hypothetical protein